MPVVNLTEGRAAFARDLARKLNGRTLTEVAWSQPDDLTLLVPIFAQRLDLAPDFYLLRLAFDCYPKFPPSAQFVNPKTLVFDNPADLCWLPKIDGHPAIATHASYNGGGQLICSSTTREFYDVKHDVDEKNVWVEGQRTFGDTLAAIHTGLQAPYYKGRWA